VDLVSNRADAWFRTFVGAHDRLEQLGSPKRLVKEHHLLDWRVKAGQEHVRDDEQLERSIRILEPLDELLPRLYFADVEL
jgi:hypothetical protein